MTRTFASWIGCFALLATTAGTSPADVDATGDWFYECDYRNRWFGQVGYYTIEMSSVSLTQTGSTLQWGPDGSGTIDPPSGVFNVLGPSQGWGHPYEGLSYSWNGTVSADGDHMEGNCKQYESFGVYRIQQVSYPLRGIRAGVSVCGDLQREPGEKCDHGDDNGTDGCCNADCTMIDPDDDWVCSDVDNCPDDYNPLRENGCGGVEPFEITKMKVDYNTQRIVIMGMLHGLGAPTLSAVDDLRVRESTLDAPIEHLFSDLVCTRGNERRLVCESPDGTKVVKVASSSTGRTKLKATLKEVAGLVALDAPLYVSFMNEHGVLRTTVVTECVRGCY